MSLLPIKESPVGNQFPETNGAAPFTCLVSHSRLVSPEDVKREKKISKMEYREEFLNRRKNLGQDEDNYLLKSISETLAYLRLSGSSNEIGPGADPEISSSGRLRHSCYFKDSSVDICGEDDDSSEFVSTNSSSSLLSSISNTTSYSEAIYANIGDITLQQMKEFDGKLTVFYKLCSQTKRLIKEFHMKYEEFPVSCKGDDNSAMMSVTIERLKSFRGELGDTVLGRLDQCKTESEMISRYTEILAACERKKMNREIDEIEESYLNLDHEICEDIEGLEGFLSAYRRLQNHLQERLSRFAVIKTRLVQVERNLVKDESSLCLRIKGIQSILSVLERDHDSSENSEIGRLLDEVRLHDAGDTSKVLSKTNDLILAEKQLLDEVRARRVLLQGLKQSYGEFMSKLANFQSWYNDYMRRLSETRVTGPDFDVQHPQLVKEREEKRVEFIEILASAKSLRASIFDYSAVDAKIEAIQDQWKSLVEKLYRARSRKTL